MPYQRPLSPETVSDEGIYATWFEAIDLVRRRTGKSFGIARTWLLKLIGSNPGLDIVTSIEGKRVDVVHVELITATAVIVTFEDPDARAWKSGFIGDLTRRTKRISPERLQISKADLALLNGDPPRNDAPHGVQTPTVGIDLTVFIEAASVSCVAPEGGHHRHDDTTVHESGPAGEGSASDEPSAPGEEPKKPMPAPPDSDEGPTGVTTDASHPHTNTASQPPQNGDGALERTDTVKKAVSLETYLNYQEDTKKTIGRLTTRTEDETWAKNKGYTRDSVRAVRPVGGL